MAEENQLSKMFADGNFGGLFRAVFASRQAASDGEYCGCAEPTGSGLTCGRCLRRSKSQELAGVHSLVDAHDFVAGRLGFCGVCMCAEDAPRHHGVPAEGWTSWGDPVAGVVPADEEG